MTEGSTNTVVICRLPKQLVEEIPLILSQPDQPQGLVQWAEIKFMRRVLAVFDSAESASTALPLIKQRVAQIPGCGDSHVGFSMNDIKNVHQQDYLNLPSTGKLLFVSPPPSPPNEWADQMEEVPNKRVHYEQEFNEKLFSALTAASLNTPSASPTTTPTSDQPESPRIVTIIPSNKNSPAILVTDSQ